MESLLMADAISDFGCHLTWPELQRVDQDQLARSWTVVRNRCVEYAELPTYFCATKNLQGFILYSLNNHMGAQEMFEELLSHDPNNICAVGNLAVLYKRQFRMRLFNDFVEKLRKVLASATDVQLARSFADRAHAIRHFEEDKRCFSYSTFIKKAVDLGNAIDVPEKAEWLLDYGLVLYRRDSQLAAGQAVLSVTGSNLKEALSCFASVIEMPNAHSSCRALAWVFLGILLRARASRSLDQAIPDDSHLNSYTPLHCFEQALSLQPDHPTVLRRVAAELTSIKEYGRAEALLKRSLEKEPSWFAHRHLGLLYLALFENGELPGDDGRRQLLDKAQEHFQIALTFKQVHADYSDLGYVYYMKKEFTRAVQEFSFAVQCKQDDFFDITITHRRWVWCLQELGEVEGARLQLAKEEEVKRKIQKQMHSMNTSSQEHGINCSGFECDLSRFDFCSSDRPGYVNILEDDSTTVETSGPEFIMRNHAPFNFDFFVSFSHIDHKWTVAFVKKLEKMFHLRGCIRYRDYEYGATIAENIAENIEKSYRSIIILSPDSLRDQWCRYELQRSHMENLRRRCIVPVMLRPCKLPKEVENLTHIKCYRGQFLVDDWYRLHETLKQTEKNTVASGTVNSEFMSQW